MKSRERRYTNTWLRHLLICLPPPPRRRRLPKSEVAYRLNARKNGLRAAAAAAAAADSRGVEADEPSRRFYKVAKVLLYYECLQIN